MSTEMLFEAITLIDSDLIDEAERFIPPKKQPVHWKRWTALAACLALVIGAGLYALPRFMLCGSSAPGNSIGNQGGSSSAAPGDSEDAESSEFLSYAGPILPLTALDGAEGITAQREITLDYLPLTDILVTDSYTLTNATLEVGTVTVLYPFVSTLYDLDERTPVLTADGETLEATAHAGGYTGGFQGVYGSRDDGLWNLDPLDNWEGYKALLEDGRYLEQALEDYPDLSGIPVVVYKFTDYYGPEANEKAGIPNPSIRAEFTLDYDKTTVLSYGFHGASWDREAGTMIQEFSIPQPNHFWYGEPYYLFVIGDDIQNLTTGGYVTGGTDPDTKTLDGCGVTVERYESDLESALYTAAELMYSRHLRAVDDAFSMPGFEMYFGLMKEFLTAYGTLGDHSIQRYGAGWLEDLDMLGVDRVFYLEAEVTVPAGESITLTAEMVKEASYDFYCAHTGNQGVYGYDLATRLGSTLTFTSQTATLEDWGIIEIVRQNFGFDLEQGVKTVELDPAEEHYYLEVQRRPAG